MIERVKRLFITARHFDDLHARLDELAKRLDRQPIVNDTRAVPPKPAPPKQCDCGHTTTSYAFHPKTGMTECLACYEARHTQG